MDGAPCLILAITNSPMDTRNNWKKEKELLSLLMNAIPTQIYSLCLTIMHQICNICLLFWLILC